MNVNLAQALGALTNQIIINGGTLASTAGTTLSTYTGTGGINLNGDFTLSGSANWSLGASAVLLGGNRTITVNTSGTTGTTIGGIISDGGNVRSLTIAAASTGTLTLTWRRNTFSGGLNVYGGTLISSQTANTAFGAAGNAISIGDPTVSNSNNATLIYSGTATTLSNPITVNAGSSGTLTLEGQTNSNTFTGTITLNNNLTLANLTAAKTTTFSNTISGGSGITIGSANLGAVLFTANENYSGPTTISGGTLQLGNATTTGALSASSAITDNGTLVFNRTNTATQGVDFATVISGSEAALTQAGSGTLVLNGANTYSGATTISAGTLSINSIQNAGSTTANALGEPATGAPSIIALCRRWRTLHSTPASANGSSNRAINLTTAAGGARLTLDAERLRDLRTQRRHHHCRNLEHVHPDPRTGSGVGSESGTIVNGIASTNVTGVTKKLALVHGPLAANNTYTGATTILQWYAKHHRFRLDRRRSQRHRHFRERRPAPEILRRLTYRLQTGSPATSSLEPIRIPEHAATGMTCAI